ncbi:MAG: class I SAM-dependent methyltransferase [Candidatus Bipolaricaulota bacterium]|nr:class I SAM-dependent methyltransferase [Candidatus Bipolaricaulota bacterium]MCX7844046.1 class I SAM-dependent methyltransferase [Candidatus Bipolaricaulota bacterium]MDW8151968.1 class I SAM-dependent methyltransferase [Candidatus Bipolaricaulota bacterium]
MVEDWPRELFIEKAELYQLQLEELLQRAEQEADAMMKLFQAHGVPAGAKLLDVCCGIGRHSVALAKRGYFMVGVDFSPKFLEKAKALALEAQVQERVEFVLWDVREIQKLPHKDFDAALCLFTSFVGYYSEEEDQKFLTSARKLTRPGGIFVLDAFSRDRLMRLFQPMIVTKTESHMIVQENTFDFEKSRLSSHWLFFLPEGNGWRYAGEATVNLRTYSLHELIRMLQEAGWKYRAAYGGLDMSPYGFEARRLVVVAQNPG